MYDPIGKMMTAGETRKEQLANAGGASRQDDLHWMSLALAEASQSGPDVPVGSVVVLNGGIVGRGRNRREVARDPTGHAEIVALREAAEVLADWRLTGTTVYTTLEPCPMCAEAIIQARVSRLVFGAYDVASGACGSAFNLFVPGRIFPIPEVLGGVCEEECRNLMVDFFRGRSGSQGEAP